MHGLEGSFVLGSFGNLVMGLRNVPTFNGDFQKERVCCMVPKLCLVTGFEILCVLKGHGLWEVTVGQHTLILVNLS